MKFEYERKKADSECVAYIDADGDLIMPDRSGNVSQVALSADGASTYEDCYFDPSEANHKFYPGDKITITF